MEIKVFVNAPYDKFVTPGTRFWNASGIDVSVGAGGVEVRTQSLVSVLAGGVAFETPPFAVKAGPAAADTVFTLYSDQSTAMKQPETVARHYVLYFNESLRGLSVGAPVTVLGLPGGEVTDVGIEVEPKTMNIRGRVEFVAYPERLIARLNRKQAAIGETMSEANNSATPFFSAWSSSGGSARPAPKRQPHHRAALRCLRLLPERAQGKNRLEPGPDGAAGGAEHRLGHRGKAHQHRHQARKVAARCDRRRS